MSSTTVASPVQMHFATAEFTLGLMDELAPLIHLHHAEISPWNDIPLDVDWLRYEMSYRAGVMRFFTARAADARGPLVGYASFFVDRHPHAQASRQAVSDVLYLHPKYRGMGGKLIDFCDAELKSEGIQIVYHHVPASHDFSPILARKGYVPVDIVLGKRLDR